jgi:hypothetical protein
MIFEYSRLRHVRRHGPSGYRSYHSYKPWLRDEFTFTCAFCLVRERWYPNGHAAFSVEHLSPKKFGKDVLNYENLLYACLQCNSLKRALLGIPDPCRDPYGLHLSINDDGTVNANSKRGEILLETFRLNDDQRVLFRKQYLELFAFLTAKMLNDPEAVELFIGAFGFPTDLPDLRKQTPPRNSRPRGLRNCYYVLRENGQLPETY